VRTAGNTGYNSNSLAAKLHINKSNAAGNSKRLYTTGLGVTQSTLRGAKNTLTAPQL